MSGPVAARDAARKDDALSGAEVREGRSTTVGGMHIARVLPTKGRQTVGDLMLPLTGWSLTGSVRRPSSSVASRRPDRTGCALPERPGVM
ncbi:MAG: hypothetical protein ACR2MA_12405 [Egibacteraceae bacterium]